MLVQCKFNRRSTIKMFQDSLFDVHCTICKAAQTALLNLFERHVTMFSLLQCVAGRKALRLQLCQLGSGLENNDASALPPKLSCNRRIKIIMPS